MLAAGLAILSFLASAATSQTPSIAFTTVEQGKSILTAHDDFVERLSPFDRSARLKTDQEVSQDAYLAFVSGSVLAWTDMEETLVKQAWADLIPRMAKWHLPLPSTIHFIKTSGREEGGQEYTRGGAIVLPASAVAAGKQATVEATIAHELFHVMSRHSPETRDRLYAIIGFLPCKEVTFPAALADKKLTDPDAPRNDHYIRLKEKDKDILAIPIVYSMSAHYDVAKGGEFSQSAAFSFLVVQPQGDSPVPTVTYDPATAALLATDEVSNFYEQVGRNTEYIIHPEEILADNFRLMLFGAADLKSPAIVEKLSAALR